MNKKKLHEKINNFKQSISEFPNYNDWDSDRAYCYYQIGLAYSELEDYENAINNFNSAIKYHADYGDAYYELGLIYTKQNDFQQAITNLKKAIKIHPKKNKIKEQLENLEKRYNEANNKYNFEVNLETCSKEEILTLSGFDEFKADDFMLQREEGKMWYKMDSFVKDFNLSPYDEVKITNRLIFPLKPIANNRRTFDI